MERISQTEWNLYQEVIGTGDPSRAKENLLFSLHDEDLRLAHARKSIDPISSDGSWLVVPLRSQALATLLTNKAAVEKLLREGVERWPESMCLSACKGLMGASSSRRFRSPLFKRVVDLLWTNSFSTSTVKIWHYGKCDGQETVWSAPLSNSFTADFCSNCIPALIRANSEIDTLSISLPSEGVDRHRDEILQTLHWDNLYTLLVNAERDEGRNVDRDGLCCLTDLLYFRQAAEIIQDLPLQMRVLYQLNLAALSRRSIDTYEARLADVDERLAFSIQHVWSQIYALLEETFEQQGLPQTFPHVAVEDGVELPLIGDQFLPEAQAAGLELAVRIAADEFQREEPLVPIPICRASLRDLLERLEIAHRFLIDEGRRAIFRIGMAPNWIGEFRRELAVSSFSFSPHLARISWLRSFSAWPPGPLFAVASSDNDAMWECFVREADHLVEWSYPLSGQFNIPTAVVWPRLTELEVSCDGPQWATLLDPSKTPNLESVGMPRAAIGELGEFRRPGVKSVSLIGGSRGAEVLRSGADLVRDLVSVNQLFPEAARITLRNLKCTWSGEGEPLDLSLLSPTVSRIMVISLSAISDDLNPEVPGWKVEKRGRRRWLSLKRESAPSTSKGV